MTGPFNQDSNAVAAWFIGPRAENHKFILKFYEDTVHRQKKARVDYFPDDPFFITDQMKNSDEFKTNIITLQNKLTLLSNELARKAVPFWSPRFMGHMNMETSMSSNLGYIAALQYNQNNVAIEASPFTTYLEIFAGKQICEMLGFNIDLPNDNDIGNTDFPSDDIINDLEYKPKIQGWGHITCDGSVANLESIWAARNLKFYPLSLKLAIDDGSPLSFIGSSFKVKLANGRERKLLKDCSTWELLNIRPTDVLDIPDRLYTEYGISSKFLQRALNDYTIQTVGKDYLEDKLQVKEPTLYFASSTMHYSWPKGCAIVGIGSKNLKQVPVDDAARMDINKLDNLLEQCAIKRQAVYAVVAIIGSTESGACDPLTDIIRLRNKYERHYGLSFVIHADAAWGGYFRSMLIKPPKGTKAAGRRGGHEKEHDSFVPMLALNPYIKDHLYNLMNCDSVTVDPHKSGYIPYPAGSLCFRDQRMRYLNSWKSPVIFRSNEESIGVYGVEGSKPGASPVATWLSHDTIGLHQKGYGILLGQAVFSCTKIYCHWATMSTDKDDFIVVPFNVLPAEKKNSKEIEDEKNFIRKNIVEKTNYEITKDEKAMDLIKELGSDLMINTFACNFNIKVKVNGEEVIKVNEDINEANYLNQRIYEEFSLTTHKDTNENKPLILTSTQFKQKYYGNCLTNFKNRLGLKGDQDLYVLINVVMSPWVTEFKFLDKLTKKFKDTLQDLVTLSAHRNTEEKDFHAFVMQGTDQLYLTHLSMFQLENHRQQVIISADISPEAKNKYLEARKKKPSHVYFLGNKYKMTLDEICNGEPFEGFIYEGFKDDGDLIPWKETAKLNFQVIDVRVLKKRHLATKFQDSNYPKDRMPFYIYGTEQQLHLDHILLKSPSIQLSADCVKFEPSYGKFTKNQRENGAIIHIIDVHEQVMQPFPEVKNLENSNSFFFQKGRRFSVELYNDPVPARQNGPGLDNVDGDRPFATGTIWLPSENEGCMFVDTCMINKDPTAKKKVENGEIVDCPVVTPLKDYYRELFEEKAEVHWYEEEKEKKKDEKEEKELDEEENEKEEKELDEEENEKEEKELDEEENEREEKELDEEENEREEKEFDEEENEKEEKEFDEEENEKEEKEFDEEKSEKEEKEFDEEKNEKEEKELDKEKNKEEKELDKEKNEKEEKELDEEKNEKEEKEIVSEEKNEKGKKDKWKKKEE